MPPHTTALIKNPKMQPPYASMYTKLHISIQLCHSVTRWERHGLCVTGTSHMCHVYGGINRRVLCCVCKCLGPVKVNVCHQPASRCFGDAEQCMYGGHITKKEN